MKIPEFGAFITPHLEALGGDTGVYVKNLATGETFARGADVPVVAASVIKIPVMIEAFRAQAAGELCLDELHALADAEHAQACFETAPEVAPEALRQAIETVAACKYLKEAYAKYGDWMTVAASYNGGQNGISRRLESQKEDSALNLWLVEETSRYM